MRIQFEKWIEENQVSAEAMNLFKESISCYRISAYRSSFIMSYIAFQNILKERILNATFKPGNINEHMWEVICNKLRDEDEWDKMVADCVKRRSPDNIFLISSSTITLYEGFRCTRNICAHGKSGKIEYFHVENLWNFIQENYLKFIVNGGKEGIIQMIENHYDTSITPLGEDPTYIIDNIKLGIKDNEMIEFLEAFYQMCKHKKRLRKIFTSGLREIELWDKIVNGSTQNIQNNVISFLKQYHVDEIDDFITKYPNTSDLFLSDNTFARKLWNEIIFNDWGRRKEGTWIILEKIIDRNIIPADEIETFNEKLFKFVGKSFMADKEKVLKKTDYFERLKTELFDYKQYEFPNGFKNANNNVEYIVSYLEVCGMDKDTVIRINSIIDKMEYGDFIDTIKNYLKKENNWVIFRKILTENEIADSTQKLES